MGLTEDIGRFLSTVSFADIPAPAVATVTRGFADCVGVMLAGRDAPATAAVRRLVGVADDVPLLGRLEIGAEARALLYGTAAHALDYDDTGLSGHPSAVLVPAVLAAGEEAGADGAAMITAYVAGYEVWAELWSREHDQLHAKGWHPSAVYGAVAAAAATAVLRRLDAAEATCAVAIAASLAGGVVANFGSMTKPFQVGAAARSGVEAARAAALGLTASPDALEHRGGLLRALSPRDTADRDTPSRIGQHWAILQQGLNLKRYPVCYALHRVLDGMLALRPRLPAARDIVGVTVEIGETQAAMLRSDRPQTGLDAKFSAQFAMAAAAIAGRCGQAELTDEFVRRQDVQDFLPKVVVQATPGSDPLEPTLGLSDRVVVQLSSREIVQGEPITRPRGHFSNPLGDAEMTEKFFDCAAGAMPTAAARRLFATLQNLPHLSSVADLYPALGPLRSPS